MGDLRQRPTLDLEEQKRDSSCSSGDMLRRPAFFSVVRPVSLVLSTTSIRSCQHCRLGTSTACWLSIRIDARPYFLKSSKMHKILSSGFLSMSHPFSLIGPVINLSLLQTPVFQFVEPPCVSCTPSHRAACTGLLGNH